MASNDVFVAVQEELARLREVPFAVLVEALSGAQGFYGEGDIPLPEKEK